MQFGEVQGESQGEAQGVLRTASPHNSRCFTCNALEFVEEQGARICTTCGSVEEGVVTQESHRAGKRLRDEARPRPHGPAPARFTAWDAEQGCWVDPEGNTKSIKGESRRQPSILPDFSPLPEDDGRPWEEWFAAMIQRDNHMTADEALQQAEADGLTLVRSGRAGGFASVSATHKKKYQGYLQLRRFFCHITMAQTVEEASLWVARFRAYPRGEEDAGARLLSMRRAHQASVREQAAVEKAKAAEERVAREAKAAEERVAREAQLLEAKRIRAEAEATRRSAAKAAEAARRAAAKEERARAHEEASRAKAAAKETSRAAAQAAKEELAARQKQAAAAQRELLRESQQRLLREAAARLRGGDGGGGGGAAGAAPTAMPQAEEMTEATFLSQPVDALVQQALAASQPGACPHQCFGLLPGAPPDKVRRRYLALALRLHPDKLQHPLASEAFVAVESAHSRLCASTGW